MNHDTTVGEKDDYYTQRAIDLQKGVVSYKSTSTKTSEAYIWTYRTTSCDVLSVITTTVPIKNGVMKEINIESKKIISYKQKSKLDVLKDSPFQHSGLHIDQQAERKKLNKKLMSERKLFMAKLNVSRYLRTKIENEAASKIQAIYRGHFTRCNFERIVDNVLVSKQIRANVKSYLANRFNLVLSLHGFKIERMNIRNQSASVIQSRFIGFLSRRAVRRKRQDNLLRKQCAAAVVIQAIMRGVAARSRIKVLLERLRLLITVKSATKIQTAFRRLVAQRKVRRRRIKLRFLASRMIQNWYRAKFSKRMAAHIVHALSHKKRTKGALAMQGIVRRFLAQRRVQRIRFRSLYVCVTRSVCRIQCLIRKFLATVNVKKLLAISRSLSAEKDQAKDDKSEQDLEKENKALLDSVDIFLQASLGKTSDVDDIFLGLSTADVHTSSDTNSEGDTILTIAAKHGNLDLVRKCLLWGFDVNHKNDSGANAVMLAVKHNHYHVMQYLVHPPLSEEELETITRFRPISEADAGFLLVAAAANVVINGDLAMLTKLITMGLNVNAINTTTGMTAIQAVCEVGSYEGFMLLVKNRADFDVVDDFGQTLVHKACGSSLKITKALLGLDPKCPIYMTEEERSKRLTKWDSDGKDCLLHAALGGQTEVIDLIEATLTAVPCEPEGSKPDISWSPADITKAVRLVETGNLLCVSKLVEIGFDASWQQQVSDDSADVATLSSASSVSSPSPSHSSMVIAACAEGDLDCIDILMTSGADFSLMDSNGRCAIHYAAACKTNSITGDVVSFILSHTNAAKCNISENSLLVLDGLGNNALHIAAKAGVKLFIEKLAPNAIAQAINVRNAAGETPLVVACSVSNQLIVEHYIQVGADAKIKDNDGHDSLWHLFHRNADGRESAGTISVCGESHLVTGKETDEQIATLHAEISMVLLLLRKGCRLYSEDSFSSRLEAMVAVLGKLGCKASAERLQSSEPGDRALQAGSCTLLKAAMDLISPFDCWRLVLGSIYYDTDGQLRMFQDLLNCGAIQLLTDQLVQSDGSRNNSSRLITATSTATTSTATTITSSGAYRASAAFNLLTSTQIHQLKDVHFLGIHIIGWLIKFKHTKGLQMFLERGGLDASTCLVDQTGSPCLHFISQYGTAEMVEVVLQSSPSCRLEQLNRAGETCGMVAAKYGNIVVAKKLFGMFACARKSLQGRYAAWVLAFARRQEKNERSTQTGRSGDDDERYFSVAPDPMYTMWYSI